MYVEGEVRSYAAAVGLSCWDMIGFPLVWYKGTCNKTSRLKEMAERDDGLNEAAISIYERGVSSDPKRLHQYTVMLQTTARKAWA